MANVVFILVGEGDQRRFLESLSKSLGVSKNVIFAGQVQHSEIPFFYAACDVFALPSLSEGFSNAALEAMAMGKPVVGTRVDGTLDQIEDGVNGYLVEPKNKYELADRLIRLLSDSKKREVMGREGRRIAQQEFNVTLRVSRTIEVYRSVL